MIKGGPNGDEGKKLIDYLMSKDVQSKVADSFGLTARNDVKLSGKNADYLAKATAGVKVIPVDWTKVLAKQSDWEKRWRSEVIGNSTKQLTVVKPAQ
jgi:2-aminoethylphosphonate transport system substrate-binding protein